MGNEDGMSAVDELFEGLDEEAAKLAAEKEKDLKDLNPDDNDPEPKIDMKTDEPDVKDLLTQIEDMKKERQGLMSAAKSERHKRQDMKQNLDNLTSTVNSILQQRQAAQNVDSATNDVLPVEFTEDDSVAYSTGAPCASPSVLPAMPHAPCTMPTIPYGRQSIDEKDVTAVCSVLRSDWLTTGPKVEEFEKAVAEYVGARYAVAVSSGTAALHAAMLALGIGPGDEVIVPPITFVATANCAVYCGARPVFADIDPRTYNIFVNDLERCITKKTRVIIPVHFAGQSSDMEVIQQIRKDAEKQFGHKIYIIEDACHALGSIYKEKKVGSCTFSDMTVMSFHPVKHITTGEGGMVLTNDENLYKRLKRVRSHGITSDPEDFINRDLAFSIPQSPNPWYYEQQELGFNYRLTDIQCALGMSQLKKLDMFRKRRREIVNTYNQAFDNIKYVQTPFESSECDSNFHLYVLLIDFDKMGIDRPQFMLELKKEGIQTQVHYIPVHLQPYFRRTFGTKEGDCPNAEQYYQKCLSIPLYPAMSDFNVNDVIERLNGVLGRKQ